MRVMVALIVASHVAGLRPDSHTCGVIHVQGAADTADRLRHTLAPFPITVAARGHGECWVRGLGACFMHALVAHLLPNATVHTGHTACTCRVKSVILPEQLGACAVGPSRGPLALRPPWYQVRVGVRIRAGLNLGSE